MNEDVYWSRPMQKWNTHLWLSSAKRVRILCYSLRWHLIWQQAPLWLSLMSLLQYGGTSTIFHAPLLLLFLSQNLRRTYQQARTWPYTGIMSIDYPCACCLNQLDRQIFLQYSIFGTWRTGTSDRSWILPM